MDNPLHAAYYADQCKSHTVQVVTRQQLATETYLVRFACPALATAMTPGQFLMIRKPTADDPLLGRAFAMYDVVADQSPTANQFDIVFHTVGKMTRLLAGAQEGDQYEVWGPLGNGFAPQPTEHLVMVAGGIGQTPFLSLAKEYLGLQQFGSPARTVPPAERVTFCYGARRKDLLAGVEDFRALGVDVQIATDDGSVGHHGLVTSVLDSVLKQSQQAVRVVCCGPERMMEAVANLCADRGVRCEVSLETPMACGMGICFSCVARVKEGDDGQWDYKRTCVDGPVFEGSRLMW